MSRIVAFSNPCFRNSVSAASRMRKRVSSAFAVLTVLRSIVIDLSTPAPLTKDAGASPDPSFGRSMEARAEVGCRGGPLRKVEREAGLDQALGNDAAALQHQLRL